MALKSYTWLVTLRSTVADRLRREEGEYAIEWAVIAGIALAAAVGAFALGAPTIGDLINTAFTALETAATP